MSHPFDDDPTGDEQDRLFRGEFNLDDFRHQLAQLQRMGPFRDVLRSIPGVRAVFDFGPEVDPDEEVDRIQRIIAAMTAEERRDPHVIDPKRRALIAAAAGVEPAAVDALVRQFDAMAAFVKRLSELSTHEKLLALTGREKLIGQTGRARAHARARPKAAPPAKLREQWDLVARTVADPSRKGPWVTIWNRNLLLWDFASDG